MNLSLPVGIFLYQDFWLKVKTFGEFWNDFFRIFSTGCCGYPV